MSRAELSIRIAFGLLFWPLIVIGAVSLLCVMSLQVGWYLTDEWLKEHA